MTPEEYYAMLEQRFASEGYSVERKLQMAGYNLGLFAMKGRGHFEYGKQARFISGTTMDTVSVDEIKKFSKTLTSYVFERWSNERTKLSIPFIVSYSASEEVKDWLSKATMDKHWAAAEFPALFVLDDSRVYYSKKTPMWGMVYYKGYRNFVERLFKP